MKWVPACVAGRIRAQGCPRSPQSWKWVLVPAVVCLGLLLTGCTPAGPRNLLEGKRLIEKGRYVQAIERLTNAVALMPTNAQALNYLGLACQYAGKPAEAE